MPASMFAEWAGQHSIAKHGIAYRGQCRSAPALAISAAIDAAAQVPRPTAAPLLSEPVTTVTRLTEARLPPKETSNQSSSQRNPSSLEIAAGSVGLDAGDPIAWRTLFELRVAYREKSGEPTRADAEILAFGDCMVQWHQRHGARQKAERCAGCGDLFTDEDVLDVGRGARVHLDPRLSCLPRYGQAWRTAAVAGLHALALDPPTGFELL